MSIVKPYKGLSRHRLTNLLNEVNGRGRVEDVDFTYGIPTATVGANGENTVVTTTPVPGTSYEGPVDVYYTRLPISVVGELPYNVIEPPVINSFPFWMRNILPELNRAFGLDLSPDEIVNTLCNEPQTAYTLSINSSSLAWLPSSITFTAVAEPLQRLDDTIQDFLDGFVPANTPLVELIVEEALDGFVRTDSNLQDIIFLNSFDGFDPKWREMEEDVGDDPLDGFIDSPADLDVMILDSLDGFVDTPSELDHVISGPLDGFELTPGDLWEAIEPYSFDGFVVGTTRLDTIIYVYGLDGFEISPGILETCLDNAHDGFVITPGALETSIPEYPDGFEPIKGDVTNSVPDRLDGFVWTDTNVNQLLTQEFLDGFDWKEGQLYEFIKVVRLDGFVTGVTSLDVIIVEALFDGFIAAPTPLEELIVSELDGFVFSPGAFEEQFPSETLNGFIFPDTAFDAVIADDKLVGFEEAPHLLDNAFSRPFDGFVFSPGNLFERIIKQYFDGFGTEEYFLAPYINDTMDGFVRGTTNLARLFDDGPNASKGKLQGFVVVPTNLGEIEILTPDGFDPVPNYLESYLRENVLLGYEEAPGPLEGHITVEYFEGFIESPMDLVDVVGYVGLSRPILSLSGFEHGEGTVEWIADVLAGFDPDMTSPSITDLITDDTPDGFVREPEWRLGLGLKITVSSLGGFDPVPEWRVPFAPLITNDTPDGFYLAPNDPYNPIAFDVVMTTYADGMGFDPVPEWRLDINAQFTSMPDGFDPRPEWRLSLLTHVDILLDGSIDRADQWALTGMSVRPGTGFIPKSVLSFDQIFDIHPLAGFGTTPEWRKAMSVAVSPIIELNKNTEYLISNNLFGKLDGLEKPEVTPWDGVIQNELLKGFVQEPDYRIEIGTVVLQVFTETLLPHTAIQMTENVTGRIADAVAAHPTPTDIDDLIVLGIQTGFDPVPDLRKRLRDVMILAYGGRLVRNDIFTMELFIGGASPGWDRYSDYDDLEDIVLDGTLPGFYPEVDTRVSLTSAVSLLLNGSIIKNDPFTLPMNVSGVLQAWDIAFDPIPIQYSVATVFDALARNTAQSFSQQLSGRTNGFIKPDAIGIDEQIEATDGFDPAPEWRTPLSSVVGITLDGALIPSTEVAASILVSGPLDGIAPYGSDRSMSDVVAEIFDALTENTAEPFNEQFTGSTDGFDKPIAATLDDWIDDPLDGFVQEAA